MKTTLTAALLLATVASLPALAGEGAGMPTDNQAGNPAATTTMTVRRGGNTDPFQWSATPMPPSAGPSQTVSVPSHSPS